MSSVSLESMDIKRLDHHGIVAGVIHDLGIIEFFNREIERGNEEIGAGEGVAAMIINGLGFSDRPLSLTPQFFEQLPTEHLIGEGVEASKLNRHRLGRLLDQIYDAGTSELFSKMAAEAVRREGVDTSAQANDTTSISVSGEYEFPDSDAIKITHGYSKDHRPDLKQIIHELVVSCDEGVPLHCRSCNGNSSDEKIFRDRVLAMKSRFSMDSTNQLWIADSKLYNKNTLAELISTRFLTRIPETIGEAKSSIEKAFSNDFDWEIISEGLKAKRYEVQHYGVDQSWLVVMSEQGTDRSRKTLTKKQNVEYEKAEREVFHLQAQRFSCKIDAQRAADKLVKSWQTIELEKIAVEEIKKHPGKGRPRHGENPSHIEIQVTVTFRRKDLNYEILKKAAFVLGTSAKELSSKEMIEKYKTQGTVERGFRFLKDPYFFASSVFLKKPERIQSLLMIMTLSLLVYTIAQRRLRKAMKAASLTIANQAGVQTLRPTLRWVFQIFWGINTITGYPKKSKKFLVQGVKDLHRKILELLSGAAFNLYFPEILIS